MRSKRGYTLAELSVAMAVGAVVMALVVMFCMSISSYIQTKKTLTEIDTEIEIVDKYVTKFIADNAFEGVEFVVKENGLGFMAYKSGGEDLFENKIEFNDKSLFYNNEELWKFERVEQINFAINEKFLKCKLLYGDDKAFNLVYKLSID